MSRRIPRRSRPHARGADAETPRASLRRRCARRIGASPVCARGARWPMGAGPTPIAATLCTADGDIGACGTECRNACGQINCRLTGCLHAGEKCCPGPDHPWICNEDRSMRVAQRPALRLVPRGTPMRQGMLQERRVLRLAQPRAVLQEGRQRLPGAALAAGASAARRASSAASTRTGAECCGSDQTCKSGKCVCKEGQTCGEHCCRKGETCSNGKCCPKGRVNCGDGECCKSSASCCGETCCTGARETCVGGAKGKQCCLRSRISGSGASARCCPGGTVATATGCCPPTNLNCCDSLDTSGLACLGPNQVCVRGACKTL